MIIEKSFAKQIQIRINFPLIITEKFMTRNNFIVIKVTKNVNSNTNSEIWIKSCLQFTTILKKEYC